MPKNSLKNPRKTKDTPHLIGATVVGERGQIVIPKEIRDRLRLCPGMQLMVMQHGDSPVMLLPVEQMQTMIREMSERMRRC